MRSLPGHGRPARRQCAPVFAGAAEVTGRIEFARPVGMFIHQDRCGRDARQGQAPFPGLGDAGYRGHDGLVGPGPGGPRDGRGSRGADSYAGDDPGPVRWPAGEEFRKLDSSGTAGAGDAHHGVVCEQSREQFAGGLPRSRASAERSLLPQRAWPLAARGLAKHRGQHRTVRNLLERRHRPDAHRRVSGRPYPVEPQSLQIHHLDQAGHRIGVQPAAAAEHDGILVRAQNRQRLFQAGRAPVSTDRCHIRDSRRAGQPADRAERPQGAGRQACRHRRSGPSPLGPTPPRGEVSGDSY